MAELSFGSTAPEGDANGLAAWVPELLAGAQAGTLYPVIAVIDCASTKIDHHKGVRIPTVGIRRIEMVLPQDRKAVARILARALERRTGKAVLPLELEDTIEQAFGLVDPEHPAGEGGEGDV